MHSFWHEIICNNSISTDDPDLVNKYDTTHLLTGAYFDTNSSYRYLLWRVWNKLQYTGYPVNENNPPAVVQFIGLNPSTADSLKNDNTVTRCINYAKAWGYDGMIMTNIFSYRATDPKDMKTVDDPIGPSNDYWLLEAHNHSKLTILCWGNHGSYRGRSEEVLKLLPHNLHFLKMTTQRQPYHPLYLNKKLKPLRWGSNFQSMINETNT